MFSAKASCEALFELLLLLLDDDDELEPDDEDEEDGTNGAERLLVAAANELSPSVPSLLGAIFSSLSNASICSSG